MRFKGSERWSKLGFKGSERGSKLGSVANNGENIASGRQSLGMLRQNLLPFGRQRALSACRPGRPVRGPLGVTPLLLSKKGSEGGSMVGSVANNVKI